MQKLSLAALAREHLERAAAASNGRSATTVFGGHEHTLRQTPLALTAGTGLAEHENPRRGHPAGPAQPCPPHQRRHGVGGPDR